MSQDTIYAHSSGQAPAAIAVIRISGPDAHAAGKTLAGSLPSARQAAVRRLRDVHGVVLDDALILRFDGPASATGEDSVEFHCHGSRAVVRAVLRALSELPYLREALPGEFTRRAFENGRMDLTEAEGLADLLEAETENQRRAALALAEGGLRRQVDAWRQRLILLSARAEAAIDYVGDEEETSADVAELTAEADELRRGLTEWLDRPRAERLKTGIRVVIAGPPNSGKSSLLNVLSEADRAIVTPVAGTTRDVIEVPVSWSGVPFVLADTAGLREAADVVERIGVERTHAEVGAADILLWTGPVEARPAHRCSIQLSTKADLSPAAAPSGFRISSNTGEGINELRSHLLQLGSTLLPHEDAVAINERQARLIADCERTLGHATGGDLVLLAESLRSARTCLDKITGQVGIEDLLDALFSRFCLGK